MAGFPIAGFALLSAIGAAAYAARWVWRKARPAPRPVGDSLISTIEWFGDQEVGRIRGIARPLGEPLIAPLSGRTCVGYEVWVTEHDGDDTTELVREVRWQPFLLDDGTGRAVIDPSVAPVEYLVGIVTTESGAFDDATAEERAVLARHGHATAPGGDHRSLTYRERALEVGEMVSVRGHGLREVDPTPAAARLGRGAPPTRLRMVTTHATPLAVSTIPADLND